MNSKKPVKFLPILLIFAFIFVSFSVFTACQTGGGNDTIKETIGPDNPDPSREAEEPTEELKDSLPDGLDFGGNSLAVICRIAGVYGAGQYEFIAEEENGENLNDAVYRRNRLVEERLNIKLNVTDVSFADIPARIRNSIAAGDNTYDLIAGFAQNTPTLGAEGLFKNLFDVPHIDFDKPWWNQNIIKESVIGGKLNFMAGDANISVLTYCMVLYINKQIMAEYELPDIYDIVFDGKWTLERMYDYTKDVYKDLNGDGIIDKNDLCGFGFFQHPAHINAFMEAAGIKMIKTDGGNKPYFSMDIERMSGLVDKTHDIFYNNPGTFASNDDYTIPDMFKNNQALIATGAFGDAEYFRDMESDYAIIPYPKYDEKQEKYLAGVAPYYSLFCIPCNSVTSEMAGAAMEAMAAESYKSVTPVYFDVMMKLKFARDETSSKIIDIIRESAYIDFSTLYNDSIYNPWGVLSDLVTKKSTNFASWYEKNEQKIQLSIDNLIEKIETMGED